MTILKLEIPGQVEEVTIEWLRHIFIPHGIHVISFSVVGDARDGRGNLSSLNRLSLLVNKSDEKSPRQMSIVIKTVPTNPQLRSYVLRVGYCSNELQMYTKVLPAINSFLEERGVSPEKRFQFPVCYYGAEQEGATADDYKCILVLEDLHESGFHVPDEGGMKSFDIDQAKIALKEMALLHASSVAYGKSQGLTFLRQKFTKLVRHRSDDPSVDNFINAGFQVTRSLLKETGQPLPEGLFERLNTLQENAKEIGAKAFLTEDPRKVNAIRHSDLWFSNVSFQNNSSGRPVKAKWFDFQNCNEGQVMMDVAFFLQLNCEPELFIKRLPEMLSFYHEVFTGVLSEAKIHLDYSYEQMEAEFSEFRMPALLHIISGAPVWCCGPRTNEVSRQRLRQAILHAYSIGEL